MKYIEKEMAAFDGKVAFEYREKIAELRDMVSRLNFEIMMLEKKRTELIAEYQKVIGIDVLLKEKENESKTKA